MYDARGNYEAKRLAEPKAQSSLPQPKTEDKIEVTRVAGKEYKFRLAFAENKEIVAPMLAQGNRTTQDCLRKVVPENEPPPNENITLGSGYSQTLDSLDQFICNALECLREAHCAKSHIPKLHEIKWFLLACESFYDKRTTRLRASKGKLCGNKK
jgi:hypothetical protein